MNKINKPKVKYSLKGLLLPFLTSILAIPLALTLLAIRLSYGPLIENLIPFERDATGVLQRRALPWATVLIFLFVLLLAELLSCFMIYARSGWGALAKFYRYGRKWRGKKLWFRRTILRNLAEFPDAFPNNPPDKSILLLCDARLTFVIGGDEQGFFFSSPFSLLPNLFIPWNDIQISIPQGGFAGWVGLRFKKVPHVLLFIPDEIASQLVPREQMNSR